jgi:hypothetical protein
MIVDQEPKNIARIKSARVEQDINQEPLAFCTRCYMCKKYKDKTRRQLGASYFLYAALRV